MEKNRRPYKYYELTDFGFPDIRKNIVIYVLIANVIIIIVIVISAVFTRRYGKRAKAVEEEEKITFGKFNFPADLGTIINHHMLLINIENLLESITAEPELDFEFDDD